MKVAGLILLLIGVVHGKPSSFDSIDDNDDTPICGYDACHAVDHDKINIHLVPHSHDDVGWLMTVDQYFYQKVQYVITSVVSALLDDPDRRFIQVETAYFYMWWNLQNDRKKAQVKQLINEGRLEIINGAWSMNDEAAVHYQSTIDQYTLGLKFLEETLGPCARPRSGWQIDPFGHSREQASLLTQFGMDSVFFGRVDYRDKEKRQEEKTMDMLWTGSANLGSESNIFSSVLNNLYTAPEEYCFDIFCNDKPIVPDVSSPDYNWESKVQNFSNLIEELSHYYPTSHFLIPMGSDFAWQAAHNFYINIDRLIQGFKLFNQTVGGKAVNIIYSTPSCYTKAVHEYVEIKNITLDLKTDDFFPYADTETTVWSGYFTSRPTSKRLERQANNLLQVTKQITALGRQPYNTNFPLNRAMGVMQHHDAITGTEKAAVEKDYHRSLVQGMNIAISNTSTSLSSILGLDNDLNLKSCLLSNVSICDESDKDKFTALVYNPLARSVSHYIQIPVNDGTWKVTGPDGEEVENSLTQPIANFNYVGEAIKKKVLEKVLLFRAENLPALGYKVYTFEKVNSISQSTLEESLTDDKIGFSDKYVTFNSSTGLLKSITLNGVTLEVSQNMLYYKSTWDSGAYIFRPDGDALEFGTPTNTILVNDGNLVREIKQFWNDTDKIWVDSNTIWITQIIRVYKEEDFIEFDWVIGPTIVRYDNLDGYGREIITRYSTDLETDGEFYTDSNGREIIYRKKNYRPTYNYTDQEPQADNYYPVNTKILIKDAETQFSVLTDRSEGGSSLKSGQIELMLSRSLKLDDLRGVGENLNETEFDKPLVVRGSHFVTLGRPSKGNAERTMAVVERDIAQRKLLQPWVFYTSEQIPVKQQSFLNKELPLNVHLLTLESWDSLQNTILIRLEHILEKSEDPNLSKEVTVDVSDLFKSFKVISMKEYTLAANVPLEESDRLKWSQIQEVEEESSPLSRKNRLSREETDLKITLAPMQIRTFIASVDPE